MSGQNLHQAEDLVTIFNTCFKDNYNTELVFGEDEPLYMPAQHSKDTHKILFANGFFASALHEVAHWCIAGEARRLLVDYGYWYQPDGRSSAEQQEFEKVEVKPQALEWAFSLAANFNFRVSLDNLNGAIVDSAAFEHNVYQQLAYYYQHGFPKRAQQFIEALVDFYRYGEMFLLPPNPSVEECRHYAY